MSKRLSKRKQRVRTQPAPAFQSVAKVVNAGAVVLDQEDKQLVIVGSDILLNQLKRDGPKIEASFDRLCEQDLRELSMFLSKTVGLLSSGLKAAVRHDRKLQVACAKLLLNAINSFGAAVALLRMGYVLQPGIIIRSLLEATSTVLHLLQQPGDLAAYEKHQLQSTKTLAAAKTALPEFGSLYGYFSNNFAHIGVLHKSVTPISEFTERHPALEANLSFFRIAVWLVYVTTELLFNALVDQPRYWHPVPGGYDFNPSSREREWMEEFFRLQEVT